MDLTEAQLSALVSVAKAHGIRADARRRAKDAWNGLEIAKRDLANFGMYANCGDSYQSSHDAAQGSFNSLVQLEIASEKAYKRAKLTALEQEPSLRPVIEKFVLGGPWS